MRGFFIYVPFGKSKVIIRHKKSFKQLFEAFCTQSGT